MARIPLTCHPRPGHPASPEAPFLDGTLFYGDTPVGSAMFLVDTGADSTLLDPARVRIPEPIYTQGKKTSVGGVGGKWPARKFGRGWSLEVLVAEGGQPAVRRLEFPSLTAMSPWGRKVKLGIEEVLHALPNSREVQNGVVEKCPTPESLLGRDLFIDSRLSLHYEPHAESYIELHLSQLPPAAPMPAATLPPVSSRFI